MRILGIDYGDARVGFAISDGLGITAQAIGTQHVSGDDKLCRYIQDIVQKEQVGRIVVGFPKNMNGSIGERGEKTKDFVDILRKNVNIDVVLWDERLTTVAAHKYLNEANVRGKKRKGVVDTISAVFILQGYIDYLAQH